MKQKKAREWWAVLLPGETQLGEKRGSMRSHGTLYRNEASASHTADELGGEVVRVREVRAGKRGGGR